VDRVGEVRQQKQNPFTGDDLLFGPEPYFFLVNCINLAHSVFRHPEPPQYFPVMETTQNRLTGRSCIAREYYYYSARGIRKRLTPFADEDAHASAANERIFSAVVGERDNFRLRAPHLIDIRRDDKKTKWRGESILSRAQFASAPKARRRRSWALSFSSLAAMAAAPVSACT